MVRKEAHGGVRVVLLNLTYYVFIYFFTFRVNKLKTIITIITNNYHNYLFIIILSHAQSKSVYIRYLDSFLDMGARALGLSHLFFLTVGVYYFFWWTH